MKLRYLLALPLIATALVGCDDIQESDALPVTNPQLPGVTINDFSVNVNQNLQSGFNLDALYNEVATSLGITPDPNGDMDPNFEQALIDYKLPLFTINVLTNEIPAGYAIEGAIQLAAQDDPTFQNPYNIDLTTEVLQSNEDNEPVQVLVSTNLYSLIYTRGTMYGKGKDPRLYYINYRTSVLVDAQGGQFQYGYYNNGSFPEYGVDPGYYVEEAYYLVGPDGFDVATAVKFEHSGENIYDDTIFTVTAKFEAGRRQWYIVPESQYQEALQTGSFNRSLCYGPTEAAAEKGELALNKVGRIPEANAKYSFTIDLSTLTFSYSQIPNFEFMYTPGPANGWSFVNNMLVYNTGDYVVYQGYVYIDEQFKLTGQPDWDPLNWGVEPGSAPALSGTLVAGGDNIVVDKSMLYLVSANMDEYTYELLPIESIAIIGNFNGWADEGVVYLTTNDYTTWTGTLTLPADDNGQWKFRMNDGWTYNLGADGDVEPVEVTPGVTLSPLVGNGKNFYLAPGFTYQITLNLADQNHYSLTAVQVAQ